MVTVGSVVFSTSVVVVCGINNDDLLQKFCNELNESNSDGTEQNEKSSWNYLRTTSSAGPDDVNGDVNGDERCSGGLLYDANRLAATISHAGDLSVCTLQMADGEEFHVAIVTRGNKLNHAELQQTAIDTLKELADQGQKSLIMLVGDLSEIPGLPWLLKPTCSPVTLNHDAFCAHRYTWISHLAAPLRPVTSLESPQRDQTSPVIPDVENYDSDARNCCPMWIEFTLNAGSEATVQQSMGIIGASPTLR